MKKRFFRSRWNEMRADQFDDWGCSTFYFEIGEDFYSAKQLEIYDNGNALKYDENHVSDEFGMLSDQPTKDKRMIRELLKFPKTALKLPGFRTKH